MLSHYDEVTKVLQQVTTTAEKSCLVKNSATVQSFCLNVFIFFTLLFSRFRRLKTFFDM